MEQIETESRIKYRLHHIMNSSAETKRGQHIQGKPASSYLGVELRQALEQRTLPHCSA
jgi:hypothetical protein